MRALGARRAVTVALAVTAVLTLSKLGVWLATSSLVVLSLAIDSAIDIVALVLLFLAVRISDKPADEEHHYGHHKAENLAAFAQTLIIGVVVVGIAMEAILRLTSDAGSPSAPWYALALLAVSALVDGIRVRMLMVSARQARSEALSAGALNFATDIGISLVALVSLVLVRSGFRTADAIGGLIVAAAAAIAAWRLGARSVNILMDRAPGAVEAIAAAAAAAPGVAEARRVRVRSSGKQLFADITVAAGRTSSLERAHDIAEGVEEEITRVAPGADVVVHVEPASGHGGLVERVLAAASRTQDVHEVHNVLVHTFSESGRSQLHVTLHAKVEPGTSLADAHSLSDRVEKAVVEELGSDVRVDTHIEPLESTSFGTDVTALRPDVVTGVQRLALAEPDVIDCHEVVLTSSANVLSVVAHVRGRGDLPLDHIHRASERIEKRVQSAHADVGAVLIHFEPA